MVTQTYTYTYEAVESKMVKVDGEWEEHDTKTVKVKHTVTVTETFILELGEDGKFDVVEAIGETVDRWKNGCDWEEEDDYAISEDAIQAGLIDGKVKVDFLGLDPSTKYNIAVSAFEGYGEGCWWWEDEISKAPAAKTSITTTVYPPIKGLKVEQNPESRSDSILVSWNQSASPETTGYIVSVFLPQTKYKEDGEWCYEEGEGEGDFYVLELDEDGNLVDEGGDLVIVNLNAGTNKPPVWQVTLEDLDANTAYIVHVYAVVENEAARERLCGEDESQFDIHEHFGEGYIISSPTEGKIKTAK
jgi:hypothetical protein